MYSSCGYNAQGHLICNKQNSSAQNEYKNVLEHFVDTATTDLNDFECGKTIRRTNYHGQPVDEYKAWCNKNAYNKHALKNGQNVYVHKDCTGCRAKPGSQVTIENCKCNGIVMKEYAAHEKCRYKGPLWANSIIPRNNILQCVDSPYAESKESDANINKHYK
jgi:hypothetical protein